MSILNYWISPDRAVFAVDTEGLCLDGTRPGMSKILLLPHANVIFAVRGDRRLFFELFCPYFFNDEAADYDSIADRFDEILRKLFEFAASNGAPEIPMQFVIAGWSARSRRMMARSCVGTCGSESFQVEDVYKQDAPAVRIAPWEFDEPVPEVLTAQDILMLARRQVRWLREDGAAGGGKLLIAELTQKQATFHEAGKLG